MLKGKGVTWNFGKDSLRGGKNYYIKPSRYVSEDQKYLCINPYNFREDDAEALLSQLHRFSDRSMYRVDGTIGSPDMFGEYRDWHPEKNGYLILEYQKDDEEYPIAYILPLE